METVQGGRFQYKENRYYLRWDRWKSYAWAAEWDRYWYEEYVSITGFRSSVAVWWEGGSTAS